MARVGAGRGGGGLGVRPGVGGGRGFPKNVLRGRFIKKHTIEFLLLLKEIILV
jgi:hypothetical protein